MPNNAPRSITKVVYNPDQTHHDEFTVIVNDAEYKRWKEGDRTIPLTEVVDSFQVLHSTQGSQGILGKPSKQQLENTFGTSKDVDVVMKILEAGEPQTAHGITTGGVATNHAKGSGTIDTKGKGLSGI
ncbi:hypothetical protein CERSUDRAFT_111087 [Gelatoporia subvermispora B]|uniref:Ribosome maturation protein SDO1/SBDS N-terminal domain-containing protein n=1 Tax=Ceriporiopsis subvermispora (strain B) TaxID=914234 RepID=M2R7V5_CERS8|nr:hypothetical protein CERSUDRAFT_111087 [Gelatoporia subvermispora B]